jgi:hypothetical protein
MRRDFELYGSTLFVDRLGRPLINMEWPLMTIAMLSGEKKLCIPSETIVFSECVDAYAWMIRETGHMTPCVRMSDIKVIFGDGILGGESLVHILGIQNSCRIVLDDHYLLSENIGAWPQKFWWSDMGPNTGRLHRTGEDVREGKVPCLFRPYSNHGRRFCQRDNYPFR